MVGRCLCPWSKIRQFKPHSRSGSIPKYTPCGIKPDKTQEAARFLEDYIQLLSSALLQPDLPHLCHTNSPLMLFTPLLIHHLSTWIAVYVEGGKKHSDLTQKGTVIASDSHQETAICCNNCIIAAISQT